MGEASKSLLAMVLACLVWGLSPLFYKLLVHVPPGEVLAHRTLWSLVFFAGVLLVQGRLREVGRVLGSLRGVGIVLFASLMIAVNWFLFIYSVQVGRVMEASLGYYIFPLVAVLIGTVAFQERLGGVQWAAVGLAALAVGILTWGLGVAPWIALILAGTFGLYGLVKKRLAAGPVVSVTAEVLLLLPVALIWLWGLHSGSWSEGRPGALFAGDWATSLLLITAGPMTAGPLILFSYASRRAAMSTIGLVQYLNPTLQFGCAVLIFAEPMTMWHGIAFPLIWLALGLYSGAALAGERRSRRAAIKAAGVSTTSV